MTTGAGAPRERASRASHATGASRRSGERESVQGSPRGEAPRITLELVCALRSLRNLRHPSQESTDMKQHRVGRRKFMKEVGFSAAAISVLPKEGFGMAVSQSARPRIRFSVIGINHSHINSQVNAVLRGGGDLVSLYAVEDDLAAAFMKTFPQVKRARAEAEILEDPSIQLVLSSAIPDQHAPVGVRVIQHGKDYMADKPGITTLEQLAE